MQHQIIEINIEMFSLLDGDVAVKKSNKRHIQMCQILTTLVTCKNCNYTSVSKNI